MANDNTFMNKASEANLAEVAAGKLAERISNNESVKKFARTMIADHSAAQAELVNIARRENLSLASEPDTEHKNTLEALGQLSPIAFDSAYMKSQLLDHRIAVKLFQEESQNGTDEQCKAYAQKYLPKLRLYQSMAEMKMGD